MAQIRLKYVIGPNGVQLAAPAYAMIKGSHLPLQNGINDADGIVVGAPLGDPRLAQITVLAEVPDDDVTVDKSAIDPAKVKAKYPTHPLVVNGVIK